ncbi:hypothetical protein JL720_6919 [Aureococcus anophagefferens]|nr:hypothetical protein JL720_6919 [Aureococcus anophagefferens]
MGCSPRHDGRRLLAAALLVIGVCAQRASVRTASGRVVAPPGFYAIGCTKCGTSTLHSILLHHPDVASTCKSTTWVRRMHYVANATLATHPARVAPASATGNRRAYAAWIEAARARAADLTASARDGAGLDEAFAAWYMYDKVATDLLWRWDAIAGDGDDGALRASTLANLAAAAAPRGSRVKGYDAYLEDFAPALESPRDRADPPLVGDFTACLFYGCDSRDPAATAADILATSRAPPRFVVVVCEPARRARSYLRMTCASVGSPKRHARRRARGPGRRRARAARARGLRRGDLRADGGAPWRAKGCLARAYRAAGNALVRGFYGDWLEVWLAATDRVYVAQLEALDAAALDALHDFLGLARAYSDVVLAERLNVAKALRADGATRFEAGPVEAVPDADAAALRELRENVFAAPLRHFCATCEPHQGKDAAQWPPMVEASSPSASTAT